MKIIRYTLITGFIAISIAFTFLTVNSISVKRDLINQSLPDESEIIDTVIVHFIHGATMNESCSYKKYRVGGLLGGHIELDIGNAIYGFNYTNGNVRIYSNSPSSSILETKNKLIWNKQTKNDRITSIHIPISTKQKSKLIKSISNKVISTKDGYSFFGHRCTSYAYKLLSEAEIFPQRNKLSTVSSFFYPRMLRYELMKFANKNELKVQFQEGDDCRFWEK